MLLRRRVSRRSPPEETGDMMELNSAARERLLPNQEGTGDYSGDYSGGGGATGDEARRRQQGGEIVNRIEGVLLRERGQGQPSLPHGTAAVATASATKSEGEKRGGSGEDYLV